MKFLGFVVLGTIIFTLGVMIASRLTLPRIVRILASFAVLITVSACVFLTLFLMFGIYQSYISDFFSYAWLFHMFGLLTPTQALLYHIHDLISDFRSGLLFTLFLSFPASLFCGIYAAKNFYTKILLWEIRMYVQRHSTDSKNTKT